MSSIKCPAGKKDESEQASACHPMQTSPLFVILVFILGTLAYSGCAPKTRQVSGQAFLVTKGAGNYKLGLVTVMAFKRAEINELVSARAKGFAQRKAELGPDLKTAQNLVDADLALSEKKSNEGLEQETSLQQSVSDLNATYQRDSGKLNEKVAKYYGMSEEWRKFYEGGSVASDSDGGRELIKDWDRVRSTLKETEQSLKTLKETHEAAKKSILTKLDTKIAENAAEKTRIAVRIDAERSDVERLTKQIYEPMSAKVFFSSLPSVSIAVAKTDADGRFILTLPASEDVVFAAQTERNIGGKEFLYHWLVPVQPPNGPGPTEILLSNDNMTAAHGGSLIITDDDAEI